MLLAHAVIPDGLAVIVTALIVGAFTLGHWLGARGFKWEGRNGS